MTEEKQELKSHPKPPVFFYNGKDDPRWIKSGDELNAIREFGMIFQKTTDGKEIRVWWVDNEGFISVTNIASISLVKEEGKILKEESK